MLESFLRRVVLVTVNALEDDARIEEPPKTKCNASNVDAVKQVHELPSKIHALMDESSHTKVC